MERVPDRQKASTLLSPAVSSSESVFGHLPLQVAPVLEYEQKLILPLQPVPQAFQLQVDPGSRQTGDS